MTDQQSELVTKFYVDTNGIYLGGFSEGHPEIPMNAVEVPQAPDDANQTYDLNNNIWLVLEA